MSEIERTSASPLGHKLPETIQEFLGALLQRQTYSPRNLDALFGFLWGLPIPFFTLMIHAHAAGLPCNPGTLETVLRENPAYVLLMLHPLLFAVLFGALGTMRANRDQRIHKLLESEISRSSQLAQMNARLTEVDRLKTEFLANVTHELKSPLVTALGYTDRILGRHLGEINERQSKGLDVSKRNLLRLRGLIDEILDFSRLEAGVVKIDAKPMDLRTPIILAVENTNLRAKEHNIEVNTQMPEGPTLVLGDAGKLTQVVTNLLDNAIKFSPPSSTIEVELHAAGDTVRLSVADHGSGIPADVLPRLFNRFSQADGSLARPHGGVGLGLVIVKKIVELHHGKVSIESQLGAGTRLQVEIPKCTAATPAAEQEVAHATNTAD